MKSPVEQMPKVITHKEIEALRRKALEVDRLHEDLRFAEEVCEAVKVLYDYRLSGCPRSIEGAAEWRAVEKGMIEVVKKKLELWDTRRAIAEPAEERIELI